MANKEHQTASDGRSVLYLSYDGLCDQIGQSQVLPYLVGCARGGHKISVISFEKPHRFNALGKGVEELCAVENIRWLPQRFRSKPPFLAKALDLRTMSRVAMAEARRGYDLVHARSYVAGAVALKVKRRLGIPMLFDMRGFWPDQRREGKRWRSGNVAGEMLYRRWKAVERQLIANADHIVVLTHEAHGEILGWHAYQGVPVSIIPCCADFELFRPAPVEARKEALSRLGIPTEAAVLGYLGSIGTVYLLDQLLRLFVAVRARRPGTKLLLVGQDEFAPIQLEGRRLGIELSAEEVAIVRVERPDVPYWLGAMDVGACFITATYSSKGVSATKLAEYLACGLPVIANRGVGDTETILREVQGGHVMPDFSDESFAEAAEAFAALRNAEAEQIRTRAQPMLNLPVAIAAYRSIYARLHVGVSAGSL